VEISLTEENYIKAIFSICKANSGAGAGTNELSGHLNNRAGSVTDMLKRLSEKKLIHYKKYKGVFLTVKGEKMALDIVRRHRLWEVFLMEKLKFSWDEVHDIAEQLEHVKSDELIRRLDRYLGKPKFDPHGDPIPDSKGQLNEAGSRPLSISGDSGEFVFRGVAEHSGAFLRYLSSIGLRIGDILRIEERNAFDGSVKVRLHKRNVFLSEKVASNILVVPEK
jgi:DtxR family transcriptional regulator, Mn-dependent transcriptional regulator